MIAKRARTWLRGGSLMILLLGASLFRAQAQTVQFSLPSFAYDVIYLTDYVDVTTQTLKSSIPDFSGTLQTTTPNLSIYLVADAYVTLRGGSKQQVAQVVTRTFTLNGVLTISSGDLARGSTGVIQVSAYSEGPGKQALLDAVTNSGQPTAPVGTYEIDLYAYAGSFFPSPQPAARPLGQFTKIINVRASNTNEFAVTLIDPQPGASVPTTLPTFTWSSSNPTNTIFVYENLPIYHSPQEAITGIPYLKTEVGGGVSTLTYPPNAPRRLQQGKSYYWFVQTDVQTNRGTETRQSEIRLFRVQLSDPLSNNVDRLLNNLGSGIAGTYGTLLSLGWTPARVTLDGKTLSLDDLNALLGTLNEQKIKDFHVE